MKGIIKGPCTLFLKRTNGGGMCRERNIPLVISANDFSAHLHSPAAPPVQSQHCCACDRCDNGFILPAIFSIKLLRHGSNFVNYDISQLAGTINHPL